MTPLAVIEVASDFSLLSLLDNDSSGDKLFLVFVVVALAASTDV